MSEPVDTSVVRVTNPSYAAFLESQAGKVISEQREQIVALQSALTAARNDKLALTGMLQQSRVALTAAQQRIRDLEHQLRSVS